MPTPLVIVTVAPEIVHAPEAVIVGTAAELVVAVTANCAP